MQVRIKEIQDRADNVSGVPWMHLFGDEIIYEKLEDGCRGLPIARAALGNHYNNAQFIANAPTDIKFLLATLQEAQFERAQENKRNRWLCTQVKQAEAREQRLRDLLKDIIAFYHELGGNTTPGLDHIYWLIKTDLSREAKV